MESLRIVLMGKDFELRLVSLVVRARELADEVVLLDLGSKDETVELAQKVDCRVVNYSGDVLIPPLANALFEDEPAEQTLLVHVNGRLKLRDLPLLGIWEHRSYITVNNLLSYYPTVTVVSFDLESYISIDLFKSSSVLQNNCNIFRDGNNKSTCSLEI